MKILGLLLAILLAPARSEAQTTPPAAPQARVSIGASVQVPDLEMTRPAVQNGTDEGEPVRGSTILRVGLTGLLIALSLYFYRISAELSRAALRRERIARCFVQGQRTDREPPPVQCCDVDQVDSLLPTDRTIQAR